MRHLLTAAAMIAFSTAALANDSTAELAAGGLVLRHTGDIDMLSEDLFISVERVRVRYVFRNRSAKPVRTIVAFPIADLDLAYDYESDVAYPSQFRTLVNGHPVRMRVERKAFAGGVDRTALLIQLKVPIDGTAASTNRIAKLPSAERDQLERLGLIRVEPAVDGQREIIPSWTLRETWYWEQVFPPGRDVRVEHSYRPGAGSSAGEALAFPEFRHSADGRKRIATYCADRTFLASLNRLTRAGGDGAELSNYWIGYVLTTGANWRSPIGDFRLVVDKGKPANLVTFCETGIKKISPTQFEVRHRNWRPTRDLDVLIVEPAD